MKSEVPTPLEVQRAKDGDVFELKVRLCKKCLGSGNLHTQWATLLCDECDGTGGRLDYKRQVDSPKTDEIESEDVTVTLKRYQWIAVISGLERLLSTHELVGSFFTPERAAAWRALAPDIRDQIGHQT